MSRWRALSLLLTAGMACAGASPARAEGRVMSLNLCADVFAVQLLPRERIQSLSFLAATSPLSPIRAQAQGLRTNRATLEEILIARPQLVLAHRYSSALMLQRLRESGIAVALVEAPATVAEAAQQWTALGAKLGNPGQAGRWREALDAVLGAKLAEAPPLAAVYGPNGLSAGPGNLMHDLLLQAGFRNLGAELGLGSIGTLPLEALLLAQPRLLVLTGDAARGDALSDRALRHPALRRFAQQRRELTLPSQYSNCGGPELIDALRQLQAARSGLDL